MRTTEYEYDTAGRLSRSVTTAEAEWDEQEQAWMLALAEREALCCTGCGGWLHETTLKANDDRYAVPAPIRCHSCVALATGRQTKGDKEKPETQRWPAPLLRPRG